jgi:DNA-binding response OmpR family regulator
MKNLKIVLVEDDQILSRVLSEELQDVGFTVVQAVDGEEGIKKVNAEKPDLVLLDVMIPKKNGFEVLKEIKSSPATETIPVIMLTMLGKDEDVKQGLQLGAKDYIVKSQHAVAEIRDKVKDFFKLESHPGSNEIKEIKK